MPERIAAAIGIVALAGMVSIGCDGEEKPPPGGDTTDVSSANDTAGDDTGSPTDVDAGDPTDTGSGGDGTGGDTRTADTASDTSSTDTSSPDGGRDGDTAASSLDLVHRPPECNVSTQTCSLTYPKETQSGLKAQVIRNASGVQGETVVFELVSGQNLASLGTKTVTTGPQGRAGTQFQTGSQSGSVRVKATLQGRPVPPIYWDVTIQ